MAMGKMVKFTKRSKKVFKPSIAKKLTNLQKAVRVLNQGVEHKITAGDTTITPTTTPQTLQTGIMPWSIVQGDAEDSRSGAEVTIQEYTFEGYLVASVAQNVRLVIVLDKACGTGAAGAGESMDPSMIWAVTGVAANQCYHNNELNLDYKKRFTVLSSKTLRFTANQLNQPFKLVMRRQVRIRYRANVGAVADLSEANISLVYGSIGSTATCTGPITCKIKYIDL